MNNATTSTAQLRAAIEEIFVKRSRKAAQSEYDRSVCIRAVATARDVFDSVPVEGNAAQYGQAVVSALAPLYENYNDPDGEFTSGKGVIGDAYMDVMALVGD